MLFLWYYLLDENGQGWSGKNLINFLSRRTCNVVVGSNKSLIDFVGKVAIVHLRKEKVP
jgi:hypothetical protein